MAGGDEEGEEEKQLNSFSSSFEIQEKNFSS